MNCHFYTRRIQNKNICIIYELKIFNELLFLELYCFKFVWILKIQMFKNNTEQKKKNCCQRRKSFTFVFVRKI